MTEDEFDQFKHECYEYLTRQQGFLFSQYGLGSYERWDYDQETGELVFSTAGVPQLAADFQVVGSISTISNTWLWSWANPQVLEDVKKDLYQVKRFGEENNLWQLTEERWSADEVDGWSMTSISGKLLNAKGGYRCPDENGALFVIFTDVWLHSG